MLQKTWHLYIDFYRRCDVVSTDCLIPENVVHIHLLVTINLINPHSALRGNRAALGFFRTKLHIFEGFIIITLFQTQSFPDRSSLDY